jgi:lipopolysaccharide/colanic/teichoic acid biosynthesis glycosyltransferase
VFIPGLDTSFYWVDAVKSLLVWKKITDRDSVTVFYRVFPFNLNAIVKRFNYDSIKNNFISLSSLSAGHNNHSLPPEGLLDFGKNISYSGSLGRSVGFGNSQDAVFNSQMNLQISGFTGDSIRIAAAITDNNLPVQPDGTTQQLNELDKVLLQFKKKGWEINLGDIDIRQDQNYFLSFYKRLQGISYQQQIRSGKESTHQLLVSGAIAKGKFTSNVFQGQDGNQGPYQLKGANNELYFAVLANTERVFMDGELLQRGQDKDYVIDYNTAEITFTPGRMVTRDKRLQVDFEYADRNFLNSLFYAGDEMNVSKKFKLNVALYHNADAKNSPINQSPDTQQKQFLADLGDSVQNAFYPSAVRDTFSVNKILYARIRSPAGNDSIYVYSTNPDSAFYTLDFAETGPNKGNYIPLLNGVNGNVYQWVPPVNGVPQGNYEPAIFLVTPKKQQLVTIGTDYQINASTLLKMDVAFSNEDVNTYSLKDKKDNTGYAGKINLVKEGEWHTGKKTGKLKTSLSYEWVDKKFKPLEPLRSAEFMRDWGLDLQPAAATESLPGVSVEIRDNKNTLFQYKVSGYLRSDAYTGLKQSVQYSQNTHGWQLDTHMETTHNNTPETKGFFFRPAVEISKMVPRYKNYTIGISYLSEHNEQRSKIADSLTALSLENETISAFLKSDQMKKNRWSFTYAIRNNGLPYRTSLIQTDRSYTCDLQAEFLKNKKYQLRIKVTYRKLTVQNAVLSGLKPDNNLLERTEYTINEGKGLITGNLLYELGEGQEPRMSFSYAEVPAGQGVYVWNDYNKDGIQQLNEFEIAQFTDQAKYIRIYTSAGDDVRANYTQFDYSLSLNPGVLSHPMRIKKQVGFIAGIKLRSDMQAREKVVSGDRPVFNPFNGKIEDTALISLNIVCNNALSFNRAGSRWGLDISNRSDYTKALSTYGFEMQQINEWTFHGRMVIGKQFTVELIQKAGNNNLYTPSFVNRNYQLQTISTVPQVTYTHSTLYRLQVSCQYAVKNNRPLYGGEKSVNSSVNFEVKVNTVSNTSISGKVTYSNITFNGSPNTTVSYSMLDGLSPGKNYLWNIEFTKRLINNLEINFSYEGRKPGDTRVIHIGQVSVRALLRQKPIKQMDIDITDEIRRNEIPAEYLFVKRLMDIIVTILILPVVLPLLGLEYLLMYFTSRGPVIFKQERVGLHGKVFTLYKIRTMVYNEKGYTTYTVKNDKRITQMGVWLRKLKLDELPQLLNVIKGEMSLVGPRPERVDIVKNCLIKSDYYYLRHQIKPGMTGWAQVNKPVATPQENFEKLPYDLYYIYNFSLLLEIGILIRTVGVIISMKSL